MFVATRKNGPAVRHKVRSRTTVTGHALAAILALTSLLDLPMRVRLGPISANGIFTVLYAAVAVLLLLLNRTLPARAVSAVRPGVVLALWAVASILWNRDRTAEALQNVAVLVFFVATIILVTNHCARSATAAKTLTKQTEMAMYFATFIFLSTALHLYGVQPRLYALYVSVGMMWFAAGWRFRSKKARLTTIGLVICVGLSQSRTALISSIVLLPWIVFLRTRSASGWLRPVAMFAVLGGITLTAIFTIPALHKRFFDAGDQGVTVNGTTISTEGRAAIWEAVYTDAMRSPVMGLGAGSASDLVIKKFGSNIGQPHNDYLRLFHDYGIIGVTLWMAFIAGLLSALRRRYRTAKIIGDLRQQRSAIAATYGIVMVLCCMTTDNIIIYPGPMCLEAILLGNALGRK